MNPRGGLCAQAAYQTMAALSAAIIGATFTTKYASTCDNINGKTSSLSERKKSENTVFGHDNHLRAAKSFPNRDENRCDTLNGKISSKLTKKLSQTVTSSNDKHPKAVISENSDYIKGIKIYGIGILEDPVPGEKRGRGKQHLTSSYWIYDMGVFLNREFKSIQSMVQYAYTHSKTYPGYDYRYFTNISNALFLKAEADGLMTADGRDFFLMAAWCAMAAAEVDGFPYGKYTPEQRANQREAFYQKYLNPEVVWIEGELDNPVFEAALGKYAIESCRIDLLPSVALERLGLHNELCALKWKKPDTWLREGFRVSSRIDSMKRHYEAIHARDTSEDHIAHLIWGFMAITHVVALFPQWNNLCNYERVRRINVLAMDKNIQELVGDGGFRTAHSGQSAQRIPTENMPRPEQALAQEIKAKTDKGERSAVENTVRESHATYTGFIIETPPSTK